MLKDLDCVGFEAACTSTEDYGWPRFKSRLALELSPWAKYFEAVYFELPSEYPICIFDFWWLLCHIFDLAADPHHLSVCKCAVKGSPAHLFTRLRLQLLESIYFFVRNQVPRPSGVRRRWLGGHSQQAHRNGSSSCEGGRSFQTSGWRPGRCRPADLPRAVVTRIEQHVGRGSGKRSKG